MKVSEAGYFTLSVVGDITKCTYDTSGFSVKARSTEAKPTPTHSKTPSKSPTSSSDPTTPGSVPNLPTGTDSGSGTAGIPTQPSSNNNSPFSLPSLAPNGSGVGFQYPTPEPQIAEPAAKRIQADDASATTPIKWGQSVAAALVLLLLSAHFGMWSRRQRLAAEARAVQTGPAGKSTRGRGPAAGRRRRRPPITELATAGTTSSGVAETGTPTGASESGVAETGGATESTATAETAQASSDGSAAEKSAPTAAEREATPARRGYRGRRRRS
ncbi:hypothetical protein AB0L00_32600 [Actinoallomurus sp. NPDC052308]|uniref:hypothetical protein n=1 Tax=Actinoallomurus sp. NPDC052308 TaxID=3155530 RepID=UPI00343C088B